jgi:hypothetical protein
VEGSNPKTREFEVTVSSGGVSCLDWGDGNIGQASDPFILDNPGYVLLDKTDDTSSGVTGWKSAVTISDLGESNVGDTSTFGKFTISVDASVFSLYENLVIAFKTGDSRTPVWAAFSLLDGALAGSFTITPKNGGTLSHANLYGVLEGPPPAVPLPGALVLMGSALLGAAGLGKWRKRRRPRCAAA